MADTENSWTQLLPLERENYILFHETAYKDDISHAEHNAVKFPRWSIISAYYAMQINVYERTLF